MGDGVNTAARLEGIGAPGGICLSPECIVKYCADISSEWRGGGM
jgi:class 3 adenylate cyclase